MGHSLSNILIHLVFSTKNRCDWIMPNAEERLYSYIIGIGRSLHCPVLQIGGTANHLHIACRLARALPISTLVEKIKSGSCKWAKEQGLVCSNFAWQHGYGAFSVSISGISALARYIRQQKQHHLSTTFQNEFLDFLQKYQIDYDQRYIWD